MQDETLTHHDLSAIGKVLGGAATTLAISTTSLAPHALDAVWEAYPVLAKLEVSLWSWDLRFCITPAQVSCDEVSSLLSFLRGGENGQDYLQDIEKALLREVQLWSEGS
jgi:hypothetical protein